MTAVQTGPTSITVIWTPPTPPDGITGYIISYTSDSDSDSVTVSGGSVAMETLTGLQNGDTYTISIVATSDTGFPSESVVAMDVVLGKLLNDSVPSTAIVMENEFKIHFHNVLWPKNDMEMNVLLYVPRYILHVCIVCNKIPAFL